MDAFGLSIMNIMKVKAHDQTFPGLTPATFLRFLSLFLLLAVSFLSLEILLLL